ATDTTDAVMESDTSLRLRAQRAYDGLSVAGPSGAYEYFARCARSLSEVSLSITASVVSVAGVMVRRFVFILPARLSRSVP
ncbi:hypothetical protein ACSLOT_28100, partial [Escherichia coli]